MSAVVAPEKLLTVAHCLTAQLNKSLRRPLTIESPTMIVASLNLCGNWPCLSFLLPSFSIIGLVWHNGLPVIRSRLLIMWSYLLIQRKNFNSFHQTYFFLLKFLNLFFVFVLSAFNLHLSISCCNASTWDRFLGNSNFWLMASVAFQSLSISFLTVWLSFWSFIKVLFIVEMCSSSCSSLIIAESVLCSAVSLVRFSTSKLFWISSLRDSLNCSRHHHSNSRESYVSTKLSRSSRIPFQLNLFLSALYDKRCSNSEELSS